MINCALKGKNKALVKILGRQHRTTHAGQILGGRDPCNPCCVDEYEDGCHSGALPRAHCAALGPSKLKKLSSLLATNGELSLN